MPKPSALCSTRRRNRSTAEIGEAEANFEPAAAAEIFSRTDNSYQSAIVKNEISPQAKSSLKRPSREKDPCCFPSEVSTHSLKEATAANVHATTSATEFPTTLRPPTGHDDGCASTLEFATDFATKKYLATTPQAVANCNVTSTSSPGLFHLLINRWSFVENGNRENSKSKGFFDS